MHQERSNTVLTNYRPISELNGFSDQNANVKNYIGSSYWESVCNAKRKTIEKFHYFKKGKKNKRIKKRDIHLDIKRETN